MSFFNGIDRIIDFFENVVVRYVTNLVAFTFKFRDSRAFDLFYCFVSCFIKKLLRKSLFTLSLTASSMVLVAVELISAIISFLV